MPKAWVVTVSMGYGHERTAYALRHLAPHSLIINAENYDGIPEQDKLVWDEARKFYEFISNFERIPIFGKLAFWIFEQFQKVVSFYPKRNLTRPNFVLKRNFDLFSGGWGKHFIEKLSEHPLPLIATFFTVAHMAEYFGYPGEIYCVICDTDIARSWAPLHPKTSRIKYFASTERSRERLIRYGVKRENIFLTGYPLPEENLGERNSGLLSSDIRYRMANLDRSGSYRNRHDTTVKRHIGYIPEKSHHPLTILFSLGGAAAQRNIAIRALKSLRELIRRNNLRFIISVGTNNEARDRFLREIVDKLDLGRHLGDSLEILWDNDLLEYFEKFNRALHTTDVLWTKPSELSFYAGLGIPIIIAPPLGSHEEANRDWLVKVGAGVEQDNPDSVDEWLFDYLNSGILAEAAMHGYTRVERDGTRNIEKIISEL